MELKMKKIYFWIIFVSASIFSGVCYSQSFAVPNVFVQGTPAKADDINANFSAVSGVINAIQNSQSNSNNSLCSDDLIGPHKYLYSYKQSNVGQTVSVGGSNYVIYRLPIYEFKTGNHYAIQIPRLVSSTSSNQISISATHVPLGSYQSSYISSCGNKISGFPASIYLYDSIRYSYGNQEYTSSTPSYNYAVTGSATLSASILINETEISINFNFPINNTDYSFIKNSQLSSQTDFVNGFPWQNIKPLPDTLIPILTQLMNYVSITQVP